MEGLPGSGSAGAEEDTRLVTQAFSLRVERPGDLPIVTRDEEAGMDIVAGAAKRVLVVDDEPEICAFLKEVLESAGLQVDVAMTAEDALGFFNEHAYDLLTLDCFMPGTSGVALHQTLSRVYGFGKRLPPTMPQRLPPVLLITGYTQDPDVREMVFGERIVCLLQKPVAAQELLRVVAEVLAWETRRSDRRQRAIVRLGARISKRN